MSTHRYIDAICVAVLVLTLLVTVLFMNGASFGLQMIVDEDAEDFEGFVPFTENDRNGAWDTSRATMITLNGDYASVSGGGAYAYNGNVMITNNGKYVLSGTLNNGSVIVDTNNAAKVWIMLDGVSIRCSDGACLDVEQADKVFLSLAEGTENSLSTESFSPENQTAGMDGAIFSRDDLTINGSGSLSVTTDAEHGIVCNDELVIAGGKITVKAAADALHANDDLRITTAEMNLTAGDDGMALTGPESEFYMESGTIAIEAGGDAVNVENNLDMLGGTMILEAEDDGISAGGALSELKIESGTVQIKATDKGITAANSILISGGTVSVEAEDDGLSGVGDIRIEGGNLTITAGDDGIHSDSAVWISGGTLLIPSCYEGIEALTIDVSGGNITIYPEDDGMNANGGSSMFGGFGRSGGGRPGEGFGMMGAGWPEPPADGEMPDGSNMPEQTALPDGTEAFRSGDLPADESAESSQMPQQQNSPEENKTDAQTQNSAFENSNSGDDPETWIHISGGSVTVINNTARDADGLDSNGDIIISGGVIRVSLVNSGSNSALDYGSESGGVMEISGGEVIACGSYAMAEGFDSSSTQCAILYNIKRGAPAGTVVSLEDREGNVLLSYEVPCSFSSVALSCPEMKLGDTYTVVIGDSVEEITLEEVSASFGDAQSEGFGGPMTWGGMRFRPESEQRGMPGRREADDTGS